MAKTASNQLGICLRIMHVRRIPKVSIFMAVTTKIVPEKAQKWPKMARFWPKWRYNGRVMAREVSFYQCLWVTKFWAKFGCSRTPRTARAPNSFIVLRCMWKEPAPLGYIYWGYIGIYWDTLGYIGIHRAIFLDARYPTLNALHHHGDIWKPDIYFIKHGTFKVNCLHLSKCHFNPTCLYFILLLQQCSTIWSEYILFYLNF